jgi:hypothetical protein
MHFLDIAKVEDEMAQVRVWLAQPRSQYKGKDITHAEWIGKLKVEILGMQKNVFKLKVCNIKQHNITTFYPLCCYIWYQQYPTGRLSGD